MTRRFVARVVAAALVVTPLTTALLAHDPTPTRATWSRDISRIFAARCANCHVAGGPAPMPLATYEDARPWAAAIRQQVLTRKMPIWHAARGYGDFANDPSLSPRDIALVTAWVDGGAPKGGDNDPPPPPAGADRRPAAQQPSSHPKGRELKVACGETPVSGRLLAVNPQLDDGASARIVAIAPGGRSEIVAWIRDYDSKHATTYWLRRPLQLPPGSRLATVASGPCAVIVTLARTTATAGPSLATSPRPR